jgi:hypothetical protein
VSWDVFAFAVPPGVRCVDDLPKDYQPRSLGARDDVISAIRQVAPHVDTTDPSWLVLQGPDHLMEVSLGKDEDVDGFTFFVRGGEGSVPLMAAIADAVGATLFDTSTGELMTAESGAASLLAWQRYRDQVVGANPPAETPASPESDGDFVIGEPARVRGRYVAHWEWTRFELRQRRKRFGSRRILCALEAADGLSATPLDVAGVNRPKDWRHHPGMSFDVVADVTPLESGHFGHRGTLHWRLRVDRWVSVSVISDGARR